MLYSGKLIRNIRTAENIKLTTLARGLCSIGQLARIENGDRSAEKLLFDSLYERLGKYSGRFTVLVNFDEYEQLRKRLYIYECIDDGKYEEAQRELDRYKKHTRNHIPEITFICFILKYTSMLIISHGRYWNSKIYYICRSAKIKQKYAYIV